MQKIPMYQKDWIKKLNNFLNINDKNILETAGKITHELAKEIAEKEFDKYQRRELKKPSKADLDFDNFVEKSNKLLKRQVAK